MSGSASSGAAPTTTTSTEAGGRVGRAARPAALPAHPAQAQVADHAVHGGGHGPGRLLRLHRHPHLPGLGHAADRAAAAQRADHRGDLRARGREHRLLPDPVRAPEVQEPGAEGRRAAGPVGRPGAVPRGAHGRGAGRRRAAHRRGRRADGHRRAHRRVPRRRGHPRRRLARGRRRPGRPARGLRDAGGRRPGRGSDAGSRRLGARARRPRRLARRGLLGGQPPAGRHARGRRVRRAAKRGLRQQRAVARPRAGSGRRQLHGAADRLARAQDQARQHRLRVGGPRQGGPRGEHRRRPVHQELSRRQARDDDDGLGLAAGPAHEAQGGPGRGGGAPGAVPDRQQPHPAERQRRRAGHPADPAAHERSHAGARRAQPRRVRRARGAAAAGTAGAARSHPGRRAGPAGAEGEDRPGQRAARAGRAPEPLRRAPPQRGRQAVRAELHQRHAAGSPAARVRVAAAGRRPGARPRLPDRGAARRVALEHHRHRRQELRSRGAATRGGDQAGHLHAVLQPAHRGSLRGRPGDRERAHQRLRAPPGGPGQAQEAADHRAGGARVAGAVHAHGVPLRDDGRHDQEHQRHRAQARVEAARHPAAHQARHAEEGEGAAPEPRGHSRQEGHVRRGRQHRAHRPVPRTTGPRAGRSSS